MNRRLYLPLALAWSAFACATPQPEPPTSTDVGKVEASLPHLTKLILIPEGTYRPLYPAKDEPRELPRPAFLLEEHPVTNGQFLAFVRANPQWQRSKVASLMAEESYLRHWTGDLDFPDSGLDAPVTNVSWFSARAYAQWTGRRLPTLSEWESVGMASNIAAYGRDEDGYNQRILNWYSRPTPPIPGPVLQTPPNFFGVSDMHGLTWEWVEDFNSALITGESRGDSGLDRSLFCAAGAVGSADPSDYAAFMRFAFRGSLKGRFTVNNLGFRCAADPQTATGTLSAPTAP